MDNLEVGKIVNTHGLKGDVKVLAWTDSPDVFEQISSVFTTCHGKEQMLTVQYVKYQKNNLIVKFKEINSIEEAETYKGQVLFASRDALPPLEDGKYYIADLIGLEVIDEDGTILGTVSDVFSTGSNDVYEVKREGQKPLLLPGIDEVILRTDLEEKRIYVHMMEGLYDL